MKITERRIVQQEWYETDQNKNGWDSNGWNFKDSGLRINETEWTIVGHLDFDKFYNPILAIAEKETEF